MIAVVDYHKGNLKSVERGLVGVGGNALITDDPAVIARADGVVLPGVGAFADAAATMRELGQDVVVRDAIARGVPFLGICLGMHLMFEEGEEGEVVTGEDEDPLRPQGLAVLPGVVARLPRLDVAGNAYKIPHVGWNSIEFSEGPLFDGISQGEFFYFTHSFAAPDTPATIATTTHSVTFPSAVCYGERAFGVQFHPEKSSDAGARMLRNFVRIVGA
ncbi:MAG: imidazole glycerol phosphate synthase subunit HisH [Eggerthellaceae bacterium]|nr:imidazole glycerol phosphate synthase subunit HisH [Eggerthellaceae bacterium]